MSLTYRDQLERQQDIKYYPKTSVLVYPPVKETELKQSSRIVKLIESAGKRDRLSMYKGSTIKVHLYTITKSEKVQDNGLSCYNIFDEHYNIKYQLDLAGLTVLEGNIQKSLDTLESDLIGYISLPKIEWC